MLALPLRLQLLVRLILDNRLVQEVSDIRLDLFDLLVRNSGGVLNTVVLVVRCDECFVDILRVFLQEILWQLVPELVDDILDRRKKLTRALAKAATMNQDMQRTVFS